MSQQIILYDIPTREPRRSRMLLNYKGLDYRTIWVEYPDVEPLIKPHLPANTVGIPYTVPTIQLPDGEWIMDSHKIAGRLEKLYPQPPLDVAADPHLAEIESLADKIVSIVCPDFIFKVAEGLLSEASLPYWHQTREAWFGGQKLHEVATEKGGAEAYRKARPLVDHVTKLLVQNHAGPFFQGATLSYADFVWASFLHFFERLDEGSLELLVGQDRTSHIALLEACRPWLRRNDH
ncbi:hypothetical protein H2200_003442 [Cladophialophora chaetospira]|uniref:GST N-terminal domain-containing protein n=1 Tax=Cladophialophora chaetospira TaxID=386627 RepID=A0AA38XHD4_9EURO|nr:hypothetical protein H2200_003442 [Cladophialophora chaetospira]